MDDKNHHVQEETEEEKFSTAEVVDFGEGSLAIIIPEGAARRLGWREGEEVKFSWQEGKISVTRSESPAG
jgi:antitoxin component of MazEF toxin-antitoxin module